MPASEARVEKAHDEKARKEKARDNRIAFLLLSPAAVIFIVFFVYPNLEVLYLSFFNWAGISPQKAFIGLQNYQKLFTQDPVFARALLNTFIVAAQSIVVQIPVALALAVALNRRLRGGNFFATVFFLPMVISLVAVGMIWAWMYDPGIGTINLFLRRIGLSSLEPAWLGDPSTALLAVLITINWVYIGLYVVVFLSGLKSIPRSVFDSAKVDGLSELWATIKITVPLLKEIIAVLVIMSISGSFKSFDLIWSMTGGGPVNATEIATTHLYKMAFRYMQSGYASAIGVSIFLICLVITVVQLRLMRVRPAAEEEIQS
ncbi:MAG: sugar ABC transporter permease [Firmicutes bacterium]|nr:sugar ABC transporter permease [Bacillota bacterium]